MKKSFASLGLSAVMSASTIALTLAATTGVAHAQVTSSSVVGTVVDSSGNPVSGASIVLRNTSTGLTRSVTTDSTGGFSVRGLPVSGAYDVTASSPSYQGKRVEGIVLSLGDTSQLRFELEAGDEVIAVGQRQVVTTLAIGPNASFGTDLIENAPAINRSLQDIIRIDPRISIDQTNNDAIQCAGQNSRFNSFTLDGVQQNDAFGLNANGFPTERQPFPFDALDQITVELAPLDVIFGNFTACNINSVTKSGTNEFHGSAFIDYTDDGLQGDTASGQDFDFGNFDEIRYGVSIGGPIIKDKVFFYAAYEKLEGANTYPNTSQTLGDGPFQVSQSVVDEIAQISRDIYQYEPGFIPTSFDNRDEKILVKLDWNISDNHRASGTFQYNDGFNIVRSDGDTNELEFSNHLYERGTELFTYTGALFSDWTDNFSTEIRGSYTDIDNRQESLGGTEFGEFRIDTGAVDVYLGSDDSRQANDLDYTVLDLIFRANYTMGDHSFTAGVETQQLDIFNLFIQQAQTETRFSSVEDFRNGIANQVEFNNAPSLNPLDAAADFGYNRNAIYLQDEWSFTDDLTLVAGLRYDFYTSDDVPVENPDFVADYGFSNAQNFDGLDLLQPRVGLTWDATDSLQFHGGVGRYSGGNPNVWLSNNFSANNVTQVGARIRGAIDLFSLDYTLAEDGVPNGPGFAVPQELADSVASGVGSNFEINYLDPDFEIPSEWKYSIGATYSPFFETGESLFGGEWFFQADLLWSEAENTAIIQRGDLVQTGTQVIDGVTYPTFDSPLLDSFVLTNADRSNKGFHRLVWCVQGLGERLERAGGLCLF